MIELAPYHKMGLPVENPILLAGGTVGYGEAAHPGIDFSALGGVVAGPVTAHSVAGSAPPRYAAVEGGMVLAGEKQNRGVKTAIKRFARLWSGLGCPVIVQIADTQPEYAGRVARRLHEAPGVSGIELLLPEHGDEAHMEQLVQSAVRAGDLPVWVKLPQARAVQIAPLTVGAGAAAIVVGQPPTGSAIRTQDDQSVEGRFYSPSVFPLMLATLQEVAALRLPCALIACGGVHTVRHVRQALEAGAQAVQIDSAVWVEPGLPAYLARAWAE